jgi:hypothetical protein
MCPLLVSEFFVELFIKFGNENELYRYESSNWELRSSQLYKYEV